MPSIADKSADSAEDTEIEYQPKNKVWNRELRNRFVIPSGKRSLRLESKDGHPRRSIRSCRRIQVLSRSHYDYPSEDDENMWDPPLSSRRLRNYREAATSSKQVDGIRRSTRQRKLKYDNYNDSWIVGAQSLRGYPSLTAPFPKGQLGAVKEEEVEEEEEEEEEGEDWEEEEEDEEKEVQEEEAEEGGEKREREEKTKAGGRVTRQDERRQEQKENGDARNNISERRTRQSKQSLDTTAEREKPEGEEAGAIVQNGHDDMYARVKQRRRAVAKGESSSEVSSTSGEEEELRTRPKRIRTSRSSRDAVHAEGKYSLRQKKPTVQRFQPGSSSEVSSSSDEEEELRSRPKRLRTSRSARDAVRSERKYSLRQKKPTVQRFQPEPIRGRNVLREVFTLRKRHRRDTSSSSSSSSESRYDRKKGKGTDRGRRNRLELCSGATKNTGLLADVDPVTLDKSITFSNVGGLEKHITALKEMVVFPILYPEVFQKFGVTPPKGVLFHGPPGTGKTLMARALANECSVGAQKVSFFMRKGADVLSKWVGESERQLRILFEEAQSARPSIIFFDELDGLAPVRSTKQDQIHASIVCTLLALMDGLDNRGDIIIIGATNRIDSIDPALRRPGRFDRELHFPLPGVKERREILEVHAGKWADKEVLNRIAETSVGFCGSDLRALCTEAVIQALRRIYPQIYTSSQKLLINHERVKVDRCDFERAQRGIVPASQRAVPSLGRKLPQYLEPLLGESLASVLSYVGEVFPAALNRANLTVPVVRSPRLLIVGKDNETSLLAAGLLYKLEHCPMLSISLDSLYADSSRNAEEAFTRVFKELPHNRGSVLWFGDIGLWWGSLSLAARAVFLTLMSSLDPTLSILFLATSVSEPLPYELRTLFSDLRSEVFRMKRPTVEQKEAFFRPLFRMRALKPPLPPKRSKDMEKLEVAPPPPPPKLSEEQMKAVFDEEENTLRELRIFLRQICAKLARNKQFYMFSKPVDVNEVPDYLQIIKEPMDLETMMTKIDLHKYACAQDFLADIDLLCRNALEYNPDRDPADKLIRHRACYLRDTAYALIKAEMDSDFEISCRSIREARKVRDENSSQRFVQEFFKEEDEDEEKEKSVKDKDKDKEKDKEKEKEEGNKRKPRRAMKWSKGIVKKPKRMKQSPNTSKDDEMNKSNSSVVEEEETPRQDETCSETEEQPAEKEDWSNRTLKLCRNKLSSLLGEAVRVTKDIERLEPLIELYSTLRAIIDNYRNLWDRTSMLGELEGELKRFATNYALQEREIDSSPRHSTDPQFVSQDASALD